MKKIDKSYLQVLNLQTKSVARRLREIKEITREQCLLFEAKSDVIRLGGLPWLFVSVHGKDHQSLPQLDTVICAE